MTPDPLGGNVSDPNSLNRYAYVLNNPTNLIDPLGLDDNCYWIGTSWECGFTISTTSSAPYAPAFPLWTKQAAYSCLFDPWGSVCQSLTGHGTPGRGGGGGGGRGSHKSGADTQKKRDLTEAALAHENLSDCLHKFFGPGKILTNANLPRIDASQYLEGGAVGGTRASMVPDTGRGTILIDKATFNSHSATDHFTMVDTYLHETANALAIQRFTGYTGKRGYRMLLGPRGGPPTADQQRAARTGVEDVDIGMQFEKCLHGEN
jgi:hypothetical protein